MKKPYKIGQTVDVSFGRGRGCKTVPCKITAVNDGKEYLVSYHESETDIRTWVSPKRIKGKSPGMRADNTLTDTLMEVLSTEEGEWQVGDFIEKDGYVAKILGKVGEVIMVSQSVKEENFGEPLLTESLLWYKYSATQHSQESMGYRLYSPTADYHGWVEVTIGEIANKFGVSVNKLKIKK